MHDTTADLEALQALLDESHARGGVHLGRIFTTERRVSANELSELLVGVQILDVATVSSDGRPFVAPVDGIFYRGRFHFGSSPDSLRFRHLRARPAVSAALTRGEDLAVLVHGEARFLDLRDPAEAGFRQALLDTYVPRYGPDWERFADDATYVRIEPRRMLTFGGVEEE